MLQIEKLQSPKSEFPYTPTCKTNAPGSFSELRGIATWHLQQINLVLVLYAWFYLYIEHVLRMTFGTAYIHMLLNYYCYVTIFLYRMCRVVLSGRMMNLKRCEIWQLHAISGDYRRGLSGRDSENYEGTRRRVSDFHFRDVEIQLVKQTWWFRSKHLKWIIFPTVGSTLL
jgi:hypothetical protein